MKSEAETHAVHRHRLFAFNPIASQDVLFFPFFVTMGIAERVLYAIFGHLVGLEALRQVYHRFVQTLPQFPGS